MSSQRSPIGLIFLTVFISMVGFGIVIPVLPVYANSEPFLMKPSELGFLVGVFSLVQLVAAPLFGRLSDRIGRKPVLLVSIVGTAVGFVVIGVAQSAWMLFLGRIIDGASGGNIATAQACIADVTPPEKRSRTMGMIGAAFGLGFVMGPALGGILSQYSTQLPFFVAAGLSVLNGVLVWARLPETYPVERRGAAVSALPLSEVFSGAMGRWIGMILTASVLSTTGFAFIHVLFALFCKDRFGWNQEQTSYGFAYVGVLAVLVQGGLLRRLLNRNIERELAIAGALILALSLWLLPTVMSVKGFMGVCALMALGNGLLTPTLSGMASRYVDQHAQGRVMGLMSASGSLGRFLGPILAVLPLPLAFSEFARPLGEADRVLVDLGYGKAFAFGAGLIALSMLCVLAAGRRSARGAGQAGA
jgi:multidrug resistance protein